MSNQTYRISGKKVIHEVIDNEVIIVNLENGHYYSVTNSGGLIWQMLIAGFDCDEIVGQLKRIFSLDTDKAEADFEDFLQSLLKENLILAEKKPGKKSGEIETIEDLGDYKKPTLEVYTDIEELLLLDPIHEVDESGWPRTGPEKIE